MKVYIRSVPICRFNFCAARDIVLPAREKKWKRSKRGDDPETSSSPTADNNGSSVDLLRSTYPSLCTANFAYTNIHARVGVIHG